MNYRDQLNTPEWSDFRSRVIEAKGYECENCREPVSFSGFQVHHCGYDFVRRAWEYEFDEVKVLCATCHDSIHRRERDFIFLFESADEETLAYLLPGLLSYAKAYTERGRCHAHTIYMFLKRQKLGPEPRIWNPLFGRSSQDFQQLDQEADEETKNLGKGIIEGAHLPAVSDILPKHKFKKAQREFRNFLLGLHERSLDPLLDGFDAFHSLDPIRQREAARNLGPYIVRLEQLHDEGRLNSASLDRK